MRNFRSNITHIVPLHSPRTLCIDPRMYHPELQGQPRPSRKQGEGARNAGEPDTADAARESKRGRAFAGTTRDHECYFMRAFECETRDEDENWSKPPSGGIQRTDSNNAKRAHIPVPPSPCVSLPPLSRGHNVPPRGRGRRSRDCTHRTYYERTCEACCGEPSRPPPAPTTPPPPSPAADGVCPP